MLGYTLGWWRPRHKSLPWPRKRRELNHGLPQAKEVSWLQANWSNVYLSIYAKWISSNRRNWISQNRDLRSSVCYLPTRCPNYSTVGHSGVGFFSSHIFYPWFEECFQCLLRAICKLANFDRTEFLQKNWPAQFVTLPSTMHLSYMLLTSISHLWMKI